VSLPIKDIRMKYKVLLIIGLLLLPLVVNCAKNSTGADSNTILDTNTITDADGNVYTTVCIGTQIWTGENLRTTRYNDGTSIPLAADSSLWRFRTTPAYCWYDNETSLNPRNSYGGLYNWFAVKTGKLAPSGWHVSTNADWDTLIAFLGGDSVAGGKLKEYGYYHWYSWNNENVWASDEYGFTALPGGCRDSWGKFYNRSSRGYWWAASMNDTEYCYAIDCSSGAVYRGKSSSIADDDEACDGFSVRLVKDK